MEGSDCNLKLFDKLSKRRDKEMKEKKKNHFTMHTGIKGHIYVNINCRVCFMSHALCSVGVISLSLWTCIESIM